MMCIMFCLSLFEGGSDGMPSCKLVREEFNEMRAKWMMFVIFL